MMMVDGQYSLLCWCAHMCRESVDKMQNNIHTSVKSRLNVVLASHAGILA